MFVTNKLNLKDYECGHCKSLLDAEEKVKYIKLIGSILCNSLPLHYRGDLYNVHIHNS